VYAQQWDCWIKRRLELNRFVDSYNIRNNLMCKQLAVCSQVQIACVTFSFTAAAAAKSLQSCPTLCDPIDGSPSDSPIPGILQARTLEWVAVSFSNAWKWKVKVKSLSCVWLFVTPWTAAYQAPPSMGFSRQEYWSGVPSPSPTSGCNFFKFILEFWTSLFKSIKTHRTTISMSMHFGWIFGKNAILPYLKHNNRKP